MSAASRLWSVIAPWGVWLVVALILVQTLPALDARWLWYSDEVRYAEAYTNVIENGRWLVLELNGQVYPDKPPVYFMALAAIHLVTGLEPVPVLFLGTALSAMALAFAMWRLGAALGLSRDARSAGLLTWLGGLGMIILLHYVRMDLLFVALMLWGQALLHDHVINRKGSAGPLVAFGLFGIATLTKGPLGVALPLAAVAVCALWAGEWRRLFTMRMGQGVLLLIGVLALWALGVVLVEGWRFFYDTMIGQQVVARATDAFHHKEPWSYYFVMLPAVMLPWTGFLLAVPLVGMARGVTSIGQRRAQKAPADMLALSALVTFGFLSSLDGKVAVYLLPVLCYLHLLIGAALMARPLRLARYATAALAAGLAVALVVYGWSPAREAGLLWSLPAGALALLALAAALVRPSDAGSRALGAGLASTAMGLVAAIGLFPILNPYLSTRPLAEALMAEAAEGATPMTYRTFGGVFTFYAGQDLPAYRDAGALAEAIATSGTAAIIAPERHLEEIDGVEVLGRYDVIGGRGTYVLLRETASGQ